MASELNTLYKKDGTEVQVNDNSLEYALNHGWTDKKPAAKKKPATKAKKSS